MSAPASTDAVEDGLANPRRAWAVLALSIAIMMAVLDGAIVNVALPTISADLGVAPANAIWVVNAYQLAITVSLLPLASLGDILGYRRVYIGGLALFTAASLVCALAPSLPWLIGARVVQGLGAAGVMSLNVAIIRFVYPKSQLGRGVGNMAVVIGSSSAAGPSVAAAILSVASWHWLFLVNVPIGAAASWLALRALPHTPRSPHRIDRFSVALNILALALLITGIDRLGDRDSLGLALAELAGAAVFGAAWVRREARAPLPILPLDLLRRPVFALSLATSITSFAAQSLALVALPFYFEGSLRLTETATGLLLTPWPLCIALIAPIAGRLADRFSPGKLASFGLLIEAAGLALLLDLPADPRPMNIAWRLAICGLGFGFFQSPNNKLIIGSAPPNRSGGASGLQSTGRLVGLSIGTAVMAVIFGRSFAQPTTVALGLSLGLTLAAAAVSGLRTVE
jgi:DHA2 family multidrug resistance protein-like MFS transporter